MLVFAKSNYHPNLNETIYPMSQCTTFTDKSFRTFPGKLPFLSPMAETPHCQFRSNLFLCIFSPASTLKVKGVYVTPNSGGTSVNVHWHPISIQPPGVVFPGYRVSYR